MEDRSEGEGPRMDDEEEGRMRRMTMKEEKEDVRGGRMRRRMS